MKRDAELHADEDKKRRELIDERNEADSLVYQVEKMLKDAGDKMSEADKAPITSAVEKVKKAKEGDDLDALRSGLRRAGASGPRDGGGPGVAGPARRWPRSAGGGQAPPNGARRTATTWSMPSSK